MLLLQYAAAAAVRSMFLVYASTVQVLWLLIVVLLLWLVGLVWFAVAWVLAIDLVLRLFYLKPV